MMYWQKGAIGGVVIVTVVMGLLFLILVGNNAMMDSRGLPNVCTDGALCSFMESTGSFGQTFMGVIVITGLFAAVLGAIVGFLLDKTRLKY